MQPSIEKKNSTKTANKSRKYSPHLISTKSTEKSKEHTNNSDMRTKKD